MNRLIFSELNSVLHKRITTVFRKRWYSQNEIMPQVTEQEIKTVLMKKFPNAKSVSVEDISGGCGAMFNIFVESSDFKGLSVIKQHKAVYESLSEQIGKIHGVHVETKVSK